MKFLFVCSANKIRSISAELHFAEEFPEHEFDSAGTNHEECLKNGTTPLSEEQLSWADKIFVMEEKHRQIIRKHTGEKHQKKIIVLGIQDIYKKPLDKKLIKVLEDKVLKHIPDMSPRFQINKPEPYILSIGDILIASESILNNPAVAVNMKYHEIPSLDSQPSQRILAAIQYDDIRVEIRHDEELLMELMNLYQKYNVEGPNNDLNLGIIKNGFEVYSIGYLREIFNYEDSFGFTFTPNYVTSR